MGKLFREGKKYTFSDYFELNNPTREIIEEFGYHYQFSQLDIPRSSKEIKPMTRLRETYIRKLPLISLNSEAARREFYVSPLILELLEYVQAEIDVEYPLDGGDNLSGTVDYLIKYTNNLIIIEAKKGDMEKGFNQLAVELIALDKTLENHQEIIYGAVTLGDVWRFGSLIRAEKRLQKDMNAYTILADLETIVSILIGILEYQVQPSL